jgi:hypothetical protein
MGLLDRLDPAAEAAMRHLIGGAVRTQAVYAVAKLGVPDHLATGPRSADDLAARVGAHGPTLRRVLRFLTALGVFIEQDDGRFALAGPGEWLQTAHPRSMRPSAIRAGEGFWQTAGGLLEAVRSGVTPHQSVHGTAFFERPPDSKARFAARMNSSMAGLAEGIAAHPALAAAGTLVDAGAGNGALLGAVLERVPHLRGIALDTPSMIATARAGDRCELVAGDFFQSIPRGDVVLLSWVLHDWDDESAKRILRACRASGATTLMVIEVLMPERATAIDAATPGVVADPFTLDLQMLLLTGGRERTLEEYRALMGEEGIRLTGASPIPSARGAALLTGRMTD